MAGVLALCFFLLCGVSVANRIWSGASVQIRLWLGACMGVVMGMWLPSLHAFFLDFTVQATCWAMVEAGVLAALCWLFPASRNHRIARGDAPNVGFVLLLVVPLLALSAYLQYTHTLREADGALWVGQSTYGDLCLHLGIATGLRGASFPPEYTLIPGTRLGYPFLFDALSSSMLLLGSDLQTAFVVPGVVAMGLVYWGFVLMAWAWTRSRLATALAYILTFLNGGLGFLYTLDGLPADASRFWAALYDFYRAPTNLIDENVRWVNLICDMLIPQRTLLAGFMMFIPAVWMLKRAVDTRARGAFIGLGIWAGLMPMVHTHSFLALGIASAGVLADRLIRDRAAWRKTVVDFGLYAGITLCLALPQLLAWTFPQTISGGSLGLRFNWVNNTGNGLRDGYLWFWIKNVGPVYLLLVPAALNAPKRARFLCVGALAIYIIAECVQFQPNEYDNNKLFYAAFLIMTPFVGLLLARIWKRMSGVRGRAILAGAFLTVCLLSAGISLARETISSYQLFSASEVEAARFIEENAPTDAVFLTGVQHNNVVTTLTGRKIVCGTGTYLYFHGVEYERKYMDALNMLAYPDDTVDLYDAYGVDYVYVSAYELYDMNADRDALRTRYPVWFENDAVTILEIPPHP